MELHEKIEQVNSREDLIKFIFDLRNDLHKNKENWENVTLENYLEAMEAWTNDMDGYFMNIKQPMPEQPSWKLIAKILYASSMYE